MKIEKNIILVQNSVGGHLVGIQAAFALNDVKSHVYYFSDDNFGFGSDGNFSDLHVIAKIKKALSLFFRASVIHYNSGRSLFPFLIDVILAKIYRKKVFVTFNGTNCRIKLYNILTNEYSQWGRRYNFDYSFNDFKKDVITMIKNYSWGLLAERVFCLNPDLMRFTINRQFFPYIKKSTYYVSNLYRAPVKGQKIRIGHAPTNRAIKGTDYFLEAVQQLNKKNDRFEIIFIENLPNTELLRIMKDVHVLLDQLWVGWYGGIAVEAMSMGIPVIAYIRIEDLLILPEKVKKGLPIINANPDTLLDVLNKIVSGEIDLDVISKQSYEYYLNNHNLDNQGKKLLNVYKSKGIKSNNVSHLV